jgi:hypothetical protein
MGSLPSQGSQGHIPNGLLPPMKKHRGIPNEKLKNQD